jgi:hypothetical protein
MVEGMIDVRARSSTQIVTVTFLMCESCVVSHVRIHA